MAGLVRLAAVAASRADIEKWAKVVKFSGAKVESGMRLHRSKSIR